MDMVVWIWLDKYGWMNMVGWIWLYGYGWMDMVVWIWLVNSSEDARPCSVPCICKYFVVLGLSQINTCRKLLYRSIFLEDDILHCLL